MRILIAGATGLIGKELVKQCLQEGWEVRFLTTRPAQAEAIPGATGFLWNIEKGEIDPEAFEGVEAIVNLAGATVSKKWSAAYKKKILSSRVSGAKIIHQSLKKVPHQVKHYLSASGISVYPNSKTQLYDETETILSNSFLGEVVVHWEQAADTFGDLGMGVAKLRTGIVLQTDEGALGKLTAPIAKGVGAILGDGKQWQSWIHIRDMAGIYVHCIKHNLTGIYNGVAPNPVTHARMTRAIAQAMGKKLWLPNVPRFVLKLFLGEMSDLVFESQLVSAKKIEQSGYRFHFVNIEQALEELL